MRSIPSGMEQNTPDLRIYWPDAAALRVATKCQVETVFARHFAGFHEDQFFAVEGWRWGIPPKKTNDRGQWINIKWTNMNLVSMHMKGEKAELEKFVSEYSWGSVYVAVRSKYHFEATS